MTHEMFKKEYFEPYDFYVESEKEFRKYPTINKITTGFCYKGGTKPIWVLFSAFQSEEEALSTINENTLIDVLDELKQDVRRANFLEGDYFVHMIEMKIREIKRRNKR